MTSFVVDSWAWIEYLEGSKRGERAKKFIDESSELLTHAVTIAEVVSRVKRRGGDYQAAADRIASLSKTIVPDRTDALEAGLLHAEMRVKRSNFSFADAFVLQSVRRYETKVLTGDPDFKGIKEAEFLE